MQPVYFSVHPYMTYKATGSAESPHAIYKANVEMGE